MAGTWEVAKADSDFERYLADMPASTIDLFWRFIGMARECGATQFALQTAVVAGGGARR